MAAINGLEGVVAAETELSLVDGVDGKLVFRGYWADNLAMQNTFEDVAHLMWYGQLPNSEEKTAVMQAFIKNRTLSAGLKQLIDDLPDGLDMMSVIRTVVSAMAIVDEWPPTPKQALQFTALVPTIIAYRQAKQTGMNPISPHPSLSHTANYLYMLNGRIPDAAEVRALEAYLTITMEHGMNASTFTARVIASTQADMASALTGAMGAMKGPLHGGAPSEVMIMLEEIGTEENIEPWLRGELDAGRRLMGFGHRVYKTRDPRATALRGVVEAQSQADPWFELAVSVEDTAIRLLDEYKPGRRLYTNVEYWAAAILRMVGMPKPLYTPTFTCSRMVGWTAHILEQASANRLIRPQSTYVGAMPESTL